MSKVDELFHQLRADYLLSILDRVGDEVGAPVQATPEQVLEAAQGLRDGLARARGYADIPGNPRPPLRERGW